MERMYKFLQEYDRFANYSIRGHNFGVTILLALAVLILFMPALIMEVVDITISFITNKLISLLDFIDKPVSSKVYEVVVTILSIPALLVLCLIMFTYGSVHLIRARRERKKEEKERREQQYDTMRREEIQARLDLDASRQLFESYWFIPEHPLREIENHSYLIKDKGDMINGKIRKHKL